MNAIQQQYGGGNDSPGPSLNSIHSRDKGISPRSLSPGSDRSRSTSRSPSPRRSSSLTPSPRRSHSPVRRRRRSSSISRSRSPVRRRRERSLSSENGSKSPQKSLSGSPPVKRRHRSYSSSLSPRRRRQRSRDRSWSRSSSRTRSRSRSRSRSGSRRSRSGSRSSRRRRRDSDRNVRIRRHYSPVDYRKSDRRKYRNNGWGKPGNMLFVAGFNFVTTEDDLRDTFLKHGRISECRIVRDNRGRNTRGFGFVTMETDEEADKAIEALDQTDWRGRILLVEKAKTPKN